MTTLHLVGPQAIEFADAYDLGLCGEAGSTHAALEGLSLREALALDDIDHVFVDDETGD